MTGNAVVALRSLRVERRRRRLRSPFVSAAVEVGERESGLVAIEAADGTVGFGEVAPLPGHDAESLDDMLDAAVTAFDASLRGAEAEAADVASLDCPRHARAALETAVLDLAGRASGRPVWSLLAGGADAPPHPLALNATVPALPPGLAAALAGGMRNRGYRCFKVKVGLPDDPERVWAVRAAVGPDSALRVDANGAWTPDEAVERLGELQRFGLEYAEEPTSGAEALARVRGRSSVPVAADESARDAEAVRELVALGAIDAAAVKLGRCGGPSAALAAALAAPAAYVTSNLEGPVGVAAALHVAVATEALGGARTAHGLATLALFEGYEAPAPEIPAPTGPGLAIESLI